MQPKPYKILIDINDYLKEETEKSRTVITELNLEKEKIKSLVSQFQDIKEFRRYALEDLDVMLIGHLWGKFISGYHYKIKPMALLSMFFISNSECLDNFDIILRLLKKEVLYSPEKNVEIRRQQTNTSSSVRFNKLSILKSYVILNESFIKTILGDQEKMNFLNEKDYSSNKEFLNDWFSYLDLLNKFSNRNFAENQAVIKLKNRYAGEYLDLVAWKNRIDRRTARTKQILPLNDLAEEYRLDENEKVILMYLIKRELEGKRCSRSSALQLISLNVQEMYEYRFYTEVDSTLAKNGLVEISEMDALWSEGGDIRVSPDITRRVITSSPINDDERLRQIIRDNDIFTLVKPTQTFDELILPPVIKQTLHYSMNQYEDNVEHTLREWKLYEGCMDSAVNSGVSLEPGMLMLFYGFPGTGKTFAAAAVAQALGKKLLITDMSRLQSKWVGDSEKNVKRIFTVFERIVRRINNPPVLLLNEADQFLSRRMFNANSSVDKMNNSLQNIFLESFESLKGVLIATTNLRDNLDEAFSRRFHLKLEFPFPATPERTELWHLHLPSSIPGAAEIDTESLAKSFELTGGQIKIIVRNACIEAASRADSSKLLMKDLVKYCNIEISASFQKRKTIGF